MDRASRIEQLTDRCGYGAAALTIIPIPGTEVLGVMPLHVGMVIGIADEYGKTVTRESALELVTQIAATVGVSLVGSRLAMTAGKILLPGFGGLLAAPFMYASTKGIGHVATLYFEQGALSEAEMTRAYKRAQSEAKSAFDPTRAKSAEAREMAQKAQSEAGTEPSESAAPKKAASVDDLADRLAKVETLHKRGAITDAEFEKRREAILDEI
ncbi:MAG: SHOCT domain-containing protein [Polyangiales bacterium]